MTARCMHCPADIELTGNGFWVDKDGFATCIKAPLYTITAGTDPGQQPGFVCHTPMPEVPAGEQQ